MDRDKYIKRKLYKQILEENERLEEEKKSLMADIRILVQNKFSSDKLFVRSKWRKHFEREEAFKKLWKEIQPGKDRGNQST
ncbi:hypothetical protein FGF1_02920 [Flavobacteriaceae bacterium GF1]